MAGCAPLDPKAWYSERRISLQAALAAFDRQGARLANGRTVAFLLALGLLGATVFQKLPPWGFLGAALAAALYVALAVVHAQVIAKEERAKVQLQLTERGLQRLDGLWRQFPSKGEAWAQDDHLYARDLDVFGQGSLFQRLDETGTLQAEALLASWLRQRAPSVQEIRARQGALRELAPRAEFRQALITEARVATRRKPDPSKFVAWAEGGSGLAAVAWAWPVAHVLPPLTLAGLLLGSWLPFPPWVPAVGLALQLVVVVLTRKVLAAAFEAVDRGEDGLVRFGDTFERIAQERFDAPLLQALQAGLESQGPPVPARMRAWNRLMGFASLRKSGQYHALINLLTLWDVHWLFRLERWRVRHGAHARAWFDALYTLEALGACAAWAFENPGFAWPEVDEGPAALDAQGLGHPLLDAPVRNDVHLPRPGAALIITGSNMSGKTTLLRALGLNAVLALAGLPVCADALRLSRLQVLTSMRVKDSLERGVSYFYAEVQRMKALLDAAAAEPGRCLFLLDELLMGTNTRERQVASQELFRLLLARGACGAITTHDLALTALADGSDGQVRNVHFRDQVEDGRMSFDYRLREGVVETTNALRVLRLAGIPMPDA